MLQENGTVWEVKFQYMREGADKFNTEKSEIANDWHAAVELAEKHMDTKGGSFRSLAKSYLLQEPDSDSGETKRVVITEKDLHSQV